MIDSFGISNLGCFTRILPQFNVQQVLAVEAHGSSLRQAEKRRGESSPYSEGQGSTTYSC